MPIPQIPGRPGIAAASRGPARSRGGFRLPDAPDLPEAAPAAATGPLPGAAMLALQETMADPVGERAARKRGHDMLDELARLQRSLLSPAGPNEETLRRLANLATAPALSLDPRLQEALDAIRLRATVELARYGFAQ